MDARQSSIFDVYDKVALFKSNLKNKLFSNIETSSNFRILFAIIIICKWKSVSFNFVLINIKFAFIRSINDYFLNCYKQLIIILTILIDRYTYELINRNGIVPARLNKKKCI